MSSCQVFECKFCKFGCKFPVTKSEKELNKHYLEKAVEHSSKFTHFFLFIFCFGLFDF